MAEPLRVDGQPAMLAIAGLQVHFGHAHVLQGIDLTLDHGVFAVVGRNGMGKTTLCNTIMGLTQPSAGSVHMLGIELTGLSPNRIVAHGVGYVPQGRRIWPSLTVDEHLRLALGAAPRGGDWDISRIYETFPRLAERKRHGGAQLSGGEQQMLAISRALLANPRLLIMDEPTEGLAPVIVDQVVAMLRGLSLGDQISVLLIEQNLGVATEVADRVSVMVNGRLVQEMSARDLASDSALQQRLLGVGAQEEQPADDGGEAAPEPTEEARVFRVRRAWAEPGAIDAADLGDTSTAGPPTFWSHNNPASRRRGEDEAGVSTTPPADESRVSAASLAAEPLRVQVADLVGRSAYVAGTFDTKGRELGYLRSLLGQLGLRTVTVDLSTSGRPSPADVGPGEVARFHPDGRDAVFTDDRGSAVTAMAEAFRRFVQTRRDLAGIVSAGGSGGTALVTPAMQTLPVGIPKVMVSTVASGDVRAYVGPADICMMYSVTDVSGINRISEQVLANAAHALAGMVAHVRKPSPDAKPAVGLTMFGVTTPCVQAVSAALESRFDCLVFHATGTGGRSMEKLADSGLLAGVIDVTTTEVCDLHMGGVFSAGEDRFGAIIRSAIPYVGSCGALDMVNWGPMDTVPERYRGRNLYRHNPQVTLMRTTAEENALMGRWIGERLNRMQGPVRFLIPEGGVSLLDRPGGAFHDPEADAALIRALQETVQQTAQRKLLRLPFNVNDPPFAQALVESFLELMEKQR